MKHFNHTQIHRGICVTKTCESFIQNRALNETADLNYVLEACLNHSIWADYRIQASLQRVQYCKRSHDKAVIDSSDILVAVIYVLLIMLNIIGSFYDSAVCRKRRKSGD